MPELGSVAEGGPDVEHGLLADEHVPAQLHRARLDHLADDPVAVEEGVLLDDGAVADGEQIGAHGHVPGEDHDTAADLRTQRPQVQRVDRRPREQDQRVRRDQRLDQPEPDIVQAPNPDLSRCPPADEHPLRGYRQGRHGEEDGGAGLDRSQVASGQAPAGGDPQEALLEDLCGEVGVTEEQQELQHPARDELPRARPCRRRRLRNRRHDLHRGSRLGERRREAPDRRVAVDVLDRDRRQVVTFADPSAEAGHEHGVRAQVVEEVGVGRRLFDAHHLGQHLGERPLQGVRGRCKRRRQARDRGVLVDVLDRDRRQVVTFADPSAEAGHEHGVRAQVVEEVGVGRDLFGPQDVGEHLGEGPHDGSGSGGSGEDEGGHFTPPARPRPAWPGAGRRRRRGPPPSWPGRWCRGSARRGPGRGRRR